jgi:hypothetical protein
MRRVLVGFFVSSVLVCGSLWSEENPPPEPVGTSVRQGPDSTVFEAILPGELVDWAPVAVGAPSLALLVEMEDETRQVMRWSIEAEGELEDLGARLPEEVESLIAYRALDYGSEDVVVAAGGTLLGLNPGGEWDAFYESPFDVFPMRDSRGGRQVPRHELILRSVGLLQSLAQHATTGELQTTWQYDLPLIVDREWGGLRLDTPPVMILAWAAAGTPRMVLGPEAHGKRRLRSVLLEPNPSGGLETLETWNMLPTAEDLEESWYVELNGELALIVTTVLAEKHGVFEKKKLRVFKLAADRTRSGSGPVLEVMTRSRNWYRTCAGVADVNGDGLDDLISAQPKGLGAGSLWVEAHLGTLEGGFDPKARGSEVEVEEGELCTLATDIDGDDRVELVVIENDALLVFPLVNRANSKVVVDEAPRWRVVFDDIDGRPRPVDLFPSSPSQILVTGHTEGKRQAVRVVRFH